MIFNSAKTTRSIYSYIFYFVDNGIASSKKFSNPFFLSFSAIDSAMLKLFRKENIQWFMFIMLFRWENKLAKSNFIRDEHSVWSEEAASIYKNVPIAWEEESKNIPKGCGEEM